MTAKAKTEAENGRLKVWSLVRDVVLVSVGVFMLVHETLDTEPSETLLVAALLLLGLPVGIRLDELRRRNGEH